MKKLLLISICFIFLITGCRNNNNNTELNIDIPENDTKDGDVTMTDIKVIINDKAYTLKLEDNKTAFEFLELLPQEFMMSELNGNEKYVYMNNHLTTNSYNPKYINAGDVMLYGDNCLVIFYKSFETNYSYTKIGHIDNLDNLGNDSIIVKFEIKPDAIQ